VNRSQTSAFAAFALTIGIISWPNSALADSVRAAEWHLASLNVVQAHSITKGADVVVSVVDSGVSPHKDLEKNLEKGHDIVPGGNGIGQLDHEGHGTEMASLIAGHGTSPNSGVLGIASAAKILPVMVTSSEQGSSFKIGDGIKWAAEHGADVINVSAAASPSQNMREGVAAASAADAVVVAGSGNRPEMVTYGYPAAISGVLAVGASDRSGQHADFSMTGPATQICAPGVDILAAEPTNKYVKVEGVSPATAIVSGAAALVRAKFPRLSAQEVIHRLTATATDIGKPGRDDECGYGVLNIVKALTADVPPLENGTAGPSATPTAVAPTPDSSPTAGDSGDASGAENTGGASKFVVGGVLIVVLVGGLVAFLMVWRRKTS
jgi:type VII secretion-associated serine protease mycosin